MNIRCIIYPPDPKIGIVSFKDWAINDKFVKMVKGTETFWSKFPTPNEYIEMLTPRLTKIAQSSILEPQPEQKVMP
jgi:hypothetical protein